MSEEATIHAGLVLSVIAVSPEPGKPSLLYVESGQLFEAQSLDTKVRLLTDVMRLIDRRLGDLFEETIKQELAGTPGAAS